jgi:hypothetical protein
MHRKEQQQQSQHHSVNRRVQIVSNDQDSKRRDEKPQEEQNFHQNRVNFSYQSNNYRKSFENLLPSFSLSLVHFVKK